MKKTSLIILLSALVCAATYAQHPSDYNAGGAFPRINADGSVTFKLNAPEAKSVTVDLGGVYPMEKDADGVWTVTTRPQVPGFHYYSMNVGGLSFADPSTYTFYGTGRYASAIEVNEDPEEADYYLPHRNVPQGAVRSIKFYSKVCQEYRRMYVYTPAEYEQNTDKRYQIIYHNVCFYDSYWSFDP